MRLFTRTVVFPLSIGTVEVYCFKTYFVGRKLDTRSWRETLQGRGESRARGRDKTLQRDGWGGGARRGWVWEWFCVRRD